MQKKSLEDRLGQWGLISVVRWRNWRNWRRFGSKLVDLRNRWHCQFGWSRRVWSWSWWHIRFFCRRSRRGWRCWRRRWFWRIDVFWQWRRFDAWRRWRLWQVIIGSGFRRGSLGRLSIRQSDFLTDLQIIEVNSRIQSPHIFSLETKSMAYQPQIVSSHDCINAVRWKRQGICVCRLSTGIGLCGISCSRWIDGGGLLRGGWRRCFGRRFPDLARTRSLSR